MTNSEPYEATIEQHQRWGPFSWSARITKGAMMFEGGPFAWTEKRVVAKARRVIRRMEAADARRRSSRRTIGGYPSSARTPAELRPPTTCRPDPMIPEKKGTPPPPLPTAFANPGGRSSAGATV